MLDDAKFVARDIMTRDVATVHPEATLLDALKIMASRRVSGLPVIDEHGTLIGMMSEGDVLGWHEGFSEREARWFDLAGALVVASPRVQPVVNWAAAKIGMATALK